MTRKCCCWILSTRIFSSLESLVEEEEAASKHKQSRGVGIVTLDFNTRWTCSLWWSSIRSAVVSTVCLHWTSTEVLAVEYTSITDQVSKWVKLILLNSRSTWTSGCHVSISTLNASLDDVHLLTRVLPFPDDSTTEWPTSSDWYSSRIRSIHEFGFGRCSGRAKEGGKSRNRNGSHSRECGCSARSTWSYLT